VIRDKAPVQASIATVTDRQKARLKDARERLLKQHQWGLITDDDLMKQIAEIDAQAVEESVVQPTRPLPDHLIESLAGNIREYWPLWTPAEKRTILLSVCRKILVYANHHEPLRLEMVTVIGPSHVEVHEEN